MDEVSTSTNKSIMNVRSYYEMFFGETSFQRSGIASGEAFGTATIAYVIAPTGIVSSESFGTPTLVVGALVIEPSGIGSGEAFGTAVVMGHVLADECHTHNIEARMALFAVPETDRLFSVRATRRLYKVECDY